MIGKIKVGDACDCIWKFISLLYRSLLILFCKWPPFFSSFIVVHFANCYLTVSLRLLLPLCSRSFMYWIPVYNFFFRVMIYYKSLFWLFLQDGQDMNKAYAAMFSPFWNEIIKSLREEDYISNRLIRISCFLVLRLFAIFSKVSNLYFWVLWL